MPREDNLMFNQKMMILTYFPNIKTLNNEAKMFRNLNLKKNNLLTLNQSREREKICELFRQFMF